MSEDRPKSGPRAGHELQPPGRVQREPFIADCTAGKYAYCTCKKSARYPLCDGSHRTEGNPNQQHTPIKVIFDEDRRVAWCACGFSANAPFCDGSHHRLD